MRILSVDELIPGMTLAKPVVNSKSQVLIGPGVKLTEKHLAVLRNFDVTEVSIEEDAPPEPPIDATRVGELDALMRPSFARANLKHPVMQDLYRQALLARLRRSSPGGRHG